MSNESGSRFQEAWEGWIQSVVILGACVLAYVAYKFDLVTESLFGSIVVILVLGTALATAWLTRRLARTPFQRALYYTLVSVWAVSTFYPALRAAVPPAT